MDGNLVHASLFFVANNYNIFYKSRRRKEEQRAPIPSFFSLCYWNTCDYTYDIRFKFSLLVQFFMWVPSCNHRTQKPSLLFLWKSSLYQIDQFRLSPNSHALSRVFSELYRKYVKLELLFPLFLKLPWRYRLFWLRNHNFW